MNGSEATNGNDVDYDEDDEYTKTHLTQFTVKPNLCIQYVSNLSQLDSFIDRCATIKENTFECFHRSRSVCFGQTS